MLKPLPAGNWNFTTAAHLLNRAGFGGSPAQIERLVELGPEKAVGFLLDFESIPETISNPSCAQPDADRATRVQAFRDASPERKKELRLEEQTKLRDGVRELRMWWLKRMASGVRPLQEKLTLFWHGHFATSIQKVKSPYYMWRQNEIFRRHGSGNWLTLLREVSKDPAMLIWLDQAQSRKEHPNENFAREIMELFTLGEGHYTERDIAEAARAFTGWSLDRPNEQFAYRERMHDDGAKTVLGKTGKLTGEDVLLAIVAQAQACRFITRKLWTFFASENPPEEVIETLSIGFAKNGGYFKPLLRTLFLAEEFYDGRVMRQQVKSPVQWLVGSVRMLERELPPGPICMNTLRMLGQDLLLPPNVKGWDGGLSWITTNNILTRYNFATCLVSGGRPRAAGAMRSRKEGPMTQDAGSDLLRLFPEEQRRDKERLLQEFEKRFLQSKLQPEHRAALREYLASKTEVEQEDLVHLATAIMRTPEFQLT